MRRGVLRSIVVITILGLWVVVSVSDLSAQTDKQLAGFTQLKQVDPTVRIRWDKKTGTPRRLVGRLSERIEADAKEIAMRFFKANEALFNMTDSKQELTTIAVKKDDRGWEHVKLQQLYKSLPVEGKQILVHINKNKEVQVVNGDYAPRIDLDTSATVQTPAAVGAARSNLNPQKELRREPSAELVVYEYEGKSHLAWKILLLSVDPLGEFIYYVDAHTGEVIHFYNNLKNALNRQTYDAGNGTTLPGTLVRSEGDADVGDQAVDDAHNNAGTVYSYYNIWYGRDSYDNAGATIVSTVHYYTNYNNAYWSSAYQQMVYGDGDGTTFSPLSGGLDIVAHELTHAVTDNESDLIYEDESGALNESLSDIFGVLMDAGDWMIGEDVYTPGTAGDALRYMDDPPAGNQPDHMDDFVVPDQFGSAMDQSCYASLNQDNGCVHFNSGIPNKAAYLMSAGGTHHGVSVLGMDRTNMGKVFYEAQVNWLTSSSDFVDARDATLDAVASVFPGDISKYNTVQNAWAAVGVGTTVIWAMELKPNPVKVGDDGDAETLVAKVTELGNPVSGATVSFTSANTSRATVSPLSGTTDADGEVSVIVTGHDKGNTIVTSIATDGTQYTSGSVQVKVPVASDVGTVIFMALFISVALVSIRKALSQKTAK